MDPRKMMGFETPGDRKVPVSVRDWDAMRRALWRSAIAWETVANSAMDLIEGCTHTEGCPGLQSETEPCLVDRYAEPAAIQVRPSPVRVFAAWLRRLGRRAPKASATHVLVTRGCPDREVRMSALVILTAARQSAPVDAPKPSDEPYFAPSREYFSEVLSSLAVAQIEIERLREDLRRATEPASPTPPLPPTLQENVE